MRKMIKHISIVIIFTMLCTSLLAQVQLKLANTIYENNELRYFKLDTTEQQQNIAAAESILKSALNIKDESTTFK